MELIETDCMATGQHAQTPIPNPADLPRAGTRLGHLIAGGTDGNERLTSMTGTVLLALLAVIGVTIVRIGQLTWLHLFVGLLLLGPVALKLASTGYRFARYYTGSASYRRKGPPILALRAIAPALIALTLLVFVSGILLLITGPRGRGQFMMLHKVSFIVWLAFAGLHVLGHLPELAVALRPPEIRAEMSGASQGSSGRWIALSGALVGGLVLAIVLIPDFASWTAHGASPHHH
jgi:hypothetical protein